MSRWKGKGKYIQAHHKATSGWEKELDTTIFKDWVKQPKNYIEYSVDHTYTPDNLKELPDGRIILVEKKGRFQDREAATKYIWIRKHLKDNEELVFVFYDPKKPFPHARKRKDGTRQTHSEWAEKNEFRWFTDSDFDETKL